MAIKASCTVTLSCYRDTQSVTRYYKLQSSTASAPSKPTANPPSGWTDSEPSYTSGSTNTLYFCDLTVFSDGTWSYSTVSKSSSYEAAKEAYNKAQNAQNSVDKMPDYIASRGENLVTNGTCLLGNNTNFSQFAYDGSDTYYAGGSFKSTSGSFAKANDEFIPVDTANKYVFSYWIKCDNASARFYDLIDSYDIDKYSIRANHVMWISGSTTTLAKELKNGDTVIYLTSAAGFSSSTSRADQRGLIFWNYTNSKGYTYGTETYSRNTWMNLWSDGSSAIDKTANTITLDSAWTHGTFPAGTPVSQCSDGGNYIYLNSNYTITANTWVQKKGSISGVGKNNAGGKFREGTAFIKIGWLGNRNVSSCTSWLSTISFTQCASISELNTMVKNVDVEYYLSTSATSLSGGSWSTTAPTWVDGKYMWSRTKTTKGDGTVSYKPSETGTCIAGAKGSTGATGKGIKSIVEQYYKSTSATTLSGGSWSATYPGWENDRYIWTRSVITYTDNTTTTTTAVCVTGAKGSTGEKGDKGDTGASGKDAAIISSTEPTDKTYLWCDTSASPPLLKQWNGEEWIIVNDNAEQITRIYKEITNSITQASENILMQVGEKTYSKEAVDRLLSDMNTSFEQTKNSFNFEFNRFQTALNDLSNSTDTKFENTSKYIRFVNGEIYIGVEGNPIMLRLRNDRLSFLENNAEVAYISNRTLYFTHAEVLKDLKIGRFAWVAMDSGYMALKLVE